MLCHASIINSQKLVGGSDHFSLEKNKVVKQIKQCDLSIKLKERIDTYHNVSKDKITHILKFNSVKYNYLHISILLEVFTQEQLCCALKKLIDKKFFDIPTIYALEKACEKQLSMIK